MQWGKAKTLSFVLLEGTSLDNCVSVGSYCVISSIKRRTVSRANPMLQSTHVQVFFNFQEGRWTKLKFNSVLYLNDRNEWSTTTDAYDKKCDYFLNVTKSRLCTWTG